MGFLGCLFKNKEKAAMPERVVYSPLKGRCIALSDVNDPVFSEGMMGPGLAILPEEGKLYAPADGEITVAFHTGHAVALKTSDGMEILIHIGIDTVNLEGDGFQTHVTEGNQVKIGDLLVSFDIQKITDAGYDPTTMIVITNAGEFGSLTGESIGNVDVKDRLFSIV